MTTTVIVDFTEIKVKAITQAIITGLPVEYSTIPLTEAIPQLSDIMCILSVVS